MDKYYVKVVETLTRVIEVEAPDNRAAYEMVQEMYDNEEIVLDADDYCGGMVCKPIRVDEVSE